MQHAVWLYLRFTLSFRDVEDLLAERGLDISYEPVRRWVGKFGGAYARELRRGRGIIDWRGVKIGADFDPSRPGSSLYSQ